MSRLERVVWCLVGAESTAARRAGAWTFHDVGVAAVEEWFEGGPVAGRRVPVEVAADGGLPVVVVMPQTGVFVGGSDTPAPAVEHRYVLVADSSLEVIYRYDGSVELS